MPNSILHKRSSTAGVVPHAALLANGEIALNTADGTWFIKKTDGTVLDLRQPLITDGGAQPLAGINADAQDWQTRVIAAGGTVSATTFTAVNTFCNAITAAGIRDRFYRLNLFCGNDLIACRVPLYRGPSLGSTQLGNALDTNNNFVSGDYVETGAAGGLSGGSPKYLDTGLAISALPALSTGHLAVYKAAGAAGNKQLIGVRDETDTNLYRIFKRGNSDNDGCWGAVNVAQMASIDKDNNGFLVLSRTSSTTARLFNNGTQSAENTTSTTPGSTTRTIFVFADNIGTATSHWQAGVPLRAYSIGASLSNSEVATYSAAMQTFQSSLSRQPLVSNADAQDWVNRVYTAGGTVSQSTATAVNTFCTAVDNAGIRDRFYRLNLFCGNDLTACRVPLYRNWKLYASRNLLSVGDNITTWSQIGTTTTFSTTERPFSTGPFANVVTATAATGATPYVVTSAGNFGYGTVTVSAYLKANGQTTVRLLLAGSSGMTFPGGGSVGYANINLSTGVVSNVLAGTSATATSVGNGWWRFAYTAVNNSTGNMAVRFDLGSGSSYNPTGTESIFIWGVQSEASGAASEYEPYPLGNTTDTNNNFVSGDYAEIGLSGGLVGNGSTKYLNPGVNLTSLVTGDRHISVYELAKGSSIYRVSIGNRYTNTPVSYFELETESPNTQYTFYSFSQAAGKQLSDTNYLCGHMLGSQTSSSTSSLYKNGTLIQTRADGAAGTPSAEPILVFALRNNTSISDYSDCRLGAYSMGASLTAAQATAYSSAMQTFQSALNRLPLVSNTEAQDWINRVYTAGGTVSQSTAAAVNTFCNTINSAGLRDRFYRLNLFCGNDLIACRVPLYRGPSLGSTQYGNTIDTNNNFIAGDYVETGTSGGLKGNGSTKYLNTGFLGNTLTAGNRHLAVYESLRDTTAYKSFIGSQDDASGTFYFALSNFSPGTGVFASFSAQAVNTGPHTTGGHWIANDPATDSLILYKSGVSLAASANTMRTTPAATALFVFAVNNNPSVATSPSGHHAGRFNGYSIGLGLTQTQAEIYYRIMQTFQTALNRAV